MPLTIVSQKPSPPPLSIVSQRPIASTLPPDTRNAFQKSVDRASEDVTPEQREKYGPVASDASQVLRSTTAGLLGPVAHPWETIKGLGRTLQEFNPANIGDDFDAPKPVGLINRVIPPGPINDMAHGIREDFRSKPLDQALAKSVGTAAGIYLGGKSGGVVGEIAKPVIAPASEFLKTSGGKMIDRAAGSTAKDFARGAQPGRAYLEGGGKPALTMARLGDQASDVANAAGTKLRRIYDTGTKDGITLPAPVVSDAVLDPVSRLRTIQDAPGGSGVSPSLEAYEDRLQPFLTSKPSFTPNEAFDLKSNIAANTRWNDPTLFDMNKVRQQGVGALGGVLSDALPEAKPLNRIYQGANNLAGRAGSRAATGSSPLTTMGRRAIELSTGGAAGMALGHPALGVLPMLLDSTPGITTGGYGLFQVGKALPAIPGILPLAGAGAAAVSPKPKADNK